MERIDLDGSEGLSLVGEEFSSAANASETAISEIAASDLFSMPISAETSQAELALTLYP
jgi:hypothetical protein